MIHDFKEVYSLLPGLDCGLCGNSSCRTMARRIIMGIASPEDCSILSIAHRGESLQRLKSILVESPIESYVSASTFSKEARINYIHPCISETGKVMAEAKLAGSTNPILGFYDSIMLCWALERSGAFEDFKCSSSLGVARLEIGEKTIMVFKDGRVNIRGARDEKEVLETMSLISRILWGAIICPRCGNAIFECVSGACEDCLRNGCPMADEGPPDPRLGERKDKGRGGIRRDVFEALRNLRTWAFFEEGLRQLDESMGPFFGLGNRLSQGTMEKEGLRMLEDIRKGLLKVEELGMKVIMDSQVIMHSPELENAKVGLILTGIALNFSRMVEGLETILKAEENFFQGHTGLFKEALRIAEEGYRSLTSKDRRLGEKVVEAYGDFKKSLLEVFQKSFGTQEAHGDEKKVLSAFGRLAVNGFFIARLSMGKFL